MVKDNPKPTGSSTQPEPASIRPVDPSSTREAVIQSAMARHPRLAREKALEHLEDMNA